MRTEIENAIAALKKGGLILYPTDTVWGIGCDATHPNTIERVDDLKKRPSLSHFLFRPFYRFWQQHPIRLGILDGKEGFILAYINAFVVFKRYVNL